MFLTKDKESDEVQHPDQTEAVVEATRQLKAALDAATALKETRDQIARDKQSGDEDLRGAAYRAEKRLPDPEDVQDAIRTARRAHDVVWQEAKDRWKAHWTRRYQEAVDELVEAVRTDGKVMSANETVRRIGVEARAAGVGLPGTGSGAGTVGGDIAFLNDLTPEHIENEWLPYLRQEKLLSKETDI